MREVNPRAALLNIRNNMYIRKSQVMRTTRIYSRTNFMYTIRWRVTSYL
jgi:hypothetical protein